MCWPGPGCVRGGGCAGRGAGCVVFDLTKQRLARHPAAVRHIPSGLMETSQITAVALAGDGPVGLLHGDLHPGNVLRGGSWRGVVAIDPSNPTSVTTRMLAFQGLYTARRRGQQTQ